VNRGEPDRVRLDLGNRTPVGALEPGDAVGSRTPLELVKARQLLLGRRDDQLAGGPGLDPALLAVGVELRRSRHAEACLERAGLVVDAGVDDAARVPGLVRADAGCAFQHHDSGVRASRRQLASDGKAHDPSADDGDIAGGWWVGAHELRD
jgi:hypothetical protein